MLTDRQHSSQSSVRPCHHHAITKMGELFSGSGPGVSLLSVHVSRRWNQSRCGRAGAKSQFKRFPIIEMLLEFLTLALQYCELVYIYVLQIIMVLTATAKAYYKLDGGVWTSLMI